MPRLYRDRLKGVLDPLPPAQIVAMPPGHHRRDVMKEVLNASRTHPKDSCLQFRFDDDDAVGLDFIDRLRETVYNCSTLTTKQPMFAVDLKCGCDVSQNSAPMGSPRPRPCGPLTPPP